MKGRRVFVTGGAGVIGMELVPRLVALGAKVTVGDLKPRPRHLTPDVDYRRGDLNDLRQDELDAFAPEVIIHLAATFERSKETPSFWEENFRHNVSLSHHILSLARHCSTLRRFVFASSYLVYDPSLYQFDEPDQPPTSLRETDPLRPRNLTGMAKLAHEMELKFIADSGGDQFSSLAVRIFRGYGRNSRDVISRWVRDLLAQRPITVFRPEGAFDYICAADSAEGLLRLTLEPQATGIVNLGTGRARKVSEIVSLLQQHFPDAEIIHTDSNIEFEASQADITRLEQLTGWKPGKALETAVGEIVAFEKERLGANQVETTSPANVLVTSASRKAPLLRATKMALSRIDFQGQVIAGDLNEAAPSKYVADDFWEMPRTEDSNLDSLILGCQELAIAVILPTRDGELLFWARNQPAFEAAGIKVIISSPNAIERCLDKYKFSTHGARLGLPVIQSATSLDLIGEGPFVVKERFGSGSRGIGLNLDHSAALEHASRLTAPLFQPYVEGPEISIDAWLDSNCKTRGVVLRHRNLVVEGESQITTTFSDEDLEAEARLVLDNFGLRGPVVMQAILSTNGMQVIEVNPRFGGASVLSIAAGLDSLYWSLQEAFGSGQIAEFVPFKNQLRLVRLPADIVFHDHSF